MFEDPIFNSSRKQANIFITFILRNAVIGHLALNDMFQGYRNVQRLEKCSQVRKRLQQWSEARKFAQK